MEKEIEEFITKRCDEALINNEEYLRLEHDGADDAEILGVATSICYSKGYSDAVNIMVRCGVGIDNSLFKSLK